jgi:sodium-dependent dicarboxylate transporter 2/3/5
MSTLRSVSAAAREEPEAPDPETGKGPSERRRLTVVLIGLALIALSPLVPSPPSFVVDGRTIALTPAGTTCLAVLLMAFLFWVTDVLPFAVTGLLAIVLMHLLGVEEFRTILARGFGHPITAFVIGILLFSLAATRTGAGRRITLYVLGKFGTSTRRTLFAFLAVGAFISAFMSDAAVAAMMVPIAVDLARSQRLEPLQSNYGKSLLIACCWGPSVGGIATPAGAVPNQLGLSFLQEIAGVRKSFADWMVIGVPSALVLLPIAWIVLVKVFPPEMDRLREPEEAGASSRSGKATRGEWFTFAAFLLTVALMLAAPALERATGREFSIEYVLLATSLLFFLPGVDVLTWNDVQRDFPWGALLLVMSGMAIGSVVHSVGVAEWISYLVLGKIGALGVFGTILATALLISLLHNFLSSNAITAVIMIPIIIHAAMLQGVSPWLAVAPAAYASTMGLVMVTTSPTNMIPYTAGYFTMRDFARAGIVMTFVGSLAVAGVIYSMHLLFGVR